MRARAISLDNPAVSRGSCSVISYSQQEANGCQQEATTLYQILLDCQGAKQSVMDFYIGSCVSHGGAVESHVLKLLENGAEKNVLPDIWDGEDWNTLLNDGPITTICNYCGDGQETRDHAGWTGLSLRSILPDNQGEIVATTFACPHHGLHLIQALDVEFGWTKVHRAFEFLSKVSGEGVELVFGFEELGEFYVTQINKGREVLWKFERLENMIHQLDQAVDEFGRTHTDRHVVRRQVLEIPAPAITPDFQSGEAEPLSLGVSADYEDEN